MLRRLDRGLCRRLARIAAIVGSWQADREDAQQERETRRVVADIIRQGLEANGIDPATVPAMQRLEAAMREPPPPLAPPRLLPIDRFHDEMATLARRCRTSALTLAEATPIELLALFCFDDGPSPAPSG